MKIQKFALSLLISLALTQPAFAAPETLTREAWSQALKPALTRHICSDQGKWLECFNLKANDCNKVATPIVNKCGEEIGKQLPEELNIDDGGKYGQKWAQCFNMSFIKQYQSQIKQDPKCAEPPAHLR